MTIESSSHRIDGSDVVESAQELVAVAREKNIQRRQRANLSTTHDVSVVIPTRNEHDNIWPLLESLQNGLRGLGVEVIFVDDSDDDTPGVIKDAARTMGSSLFHI